MEYGKEVSTSNSNLVLTTAEIHPAPNPGYGKNAARNQHVPQQFEIHFCCPSLGKERIPIPTAVQFTVRPSRPLLAQVGP